MSKRQGSEIFNTNNIRTDEYVLLAKVITGNGSTPEEAVKDLELLDDLLALQKIELIINGQKYTSTGRLRRNSGLLDLMEGRIEQMINEQ